MGSSCKECGKELSQDSFVFVEAEPNGKAMAQWHAILLKKSKIEEIVKQNMVKKRDEIRCLDCEALILEELAKQIKEAEVEQKTYESFLQSYHEKIKSDDPDHILKEIAELEEEERVTKLMIEEAQQIQQKTLKELEEVQQRSKLLDEREQEYWKQFAEFQSRSHMYSDEHEIIMGKIQYGTSQLKLLEMKNVYQDTFYITTSGRIGTINNLRFGRLPDTPVEWEEINAGWGQAALLLFIISKKGSFSIKNFKLRPMGNRSIVEELDENKKVVVKELWGSNELGFGGWLTNWGFGKKNNNFDEAMVSFLRCLGEVCHEVEKQDSHVIIPYSIEGEKIGNLTVRMQSTTEENWTKALKHVLTNLNFLLAGTANKKNKSSS